jgi:transposase
MIQRQLKLRLTKAQKSQLNDWLWHCTGVFNWAIRKIEQDASYGIYHRKQDFQNLLAGHSEKMGMPSHTMQAMLTQAFVAWDRCFKKLAKKPRLKGARNKLNSVPFPDPFKAPGQNRIHVPGLGKVRFHKQELPAGRIKCGRIIKRASGWYLALTIDADINMASGFKAADHRTIGIDPGFKDLLSLSDGTVVANDRLLDSSLNRLAQAQRGGDKVLAARLQERIANRKKDRNHKLSRHLVETCAVIAFSKDNIKGIQRKFGRSVANANHYQLRQMLAYKSSACGRCYIEPDSANSTRVCSACGSVSGPAGFAGLSVRRWECDGCGTRHDRDTNAAINTLTAALGSSVELRYQA